MNSRWKITTTLVMVLALIIVGSLGSLAYAKDRVQERARDKDCTDVPNHQYCDNELLDCEQDRLKQCLRDCDKDFDCINDCLNLKTTLNLHLNEITEKIEKYKEIEKLLEEAKIDGYEDTIEEIELELEKTRLEIKEMVQLKTREIENISNKIKECNQFKHSNK